MAHLRRKNFEEKFLIVVKNRKGHKCECQWIVMAIIKWDGINVELADDIYEKMKEMLDLMELLFHENVLPILKKLVLAKG